MTRRTGAFSFSSPPVPLLAASGATVLDDYGSSADEDAPRRIAEINWRHTANGAELRFKPSSDRYYGVAFELPALLAEQVLGLDDWRHAAGPLLFLAGAFFCALLVRRMTGSTAIALLAFALFVLQPRLYAHSFFNSKDVPALALFSVCLYLAHRAFRRGDAGAFLLCGVAFLHPHQQVYFNGLEDRTTPWRIRERYEFGYWTAAFRADLGRALAERPGADVCICGFDDGHLRRNRRILRA